MRTEPGIGDKYQAETKYHRATMPESRPWTGEPSKYKEHESCLALLDLPAPAETGGRALWEVVAERRSVRKYSPGAVLQEELSQVLWATQGVTARHGGYDFRSAPSAGALYPLETYLIVHNVEGLEPGVYHYRILSHQLEMLKKGDFRGEIAAATLGQKMTSHAALAFVWTAIVQRIKWKYGQRGYRYLYLEAGHVGAHLSLAAVSLGLATCQVGALFDDEVNAIVGVDGTEETVLYVSTLGRP